MNRRLILLIGVSKVNSKQYDNSRDEETKEEED